MRSWSIAADFRVSCCMHFFGLLLLFVWLMLEVVLVEVAFAVFAVIVVYGPVFFCIMAL
jgi:hypothetical protein